MRDLERCLLWGAVACALGHGRSPDGPWAALVVLGNLAVALWFMGWAAWRLIRGADQPRT